jgi:hypothetical protein
MAAAGAAPGAAAPGRTDTTPPPPPAAANRPVTKASTPGDTATCLHLPQSFCGGRTPLRQPRPNTALAVSNVHTVKCRYSNILLLWSGAGQVALM